MRVNVRWSWTNWTFGFWWGRFGRTGRLLGGIDIGPFELCIRDMREDKR